MTICVAYTYKGKSYMGSDTLVTNGDEISRQKHSKMVEFKGFVCGYAGEAKLRTILLKLAAKKNVVVKDEIDAAIFRDRVIRSLEKDEEVSLLIVTKKGRIFVIDRTSVVEPAEDYATIGSGSSYGQAIMFAQYPDINCIQKAIEAAIQYSNTCGGEICIKQIN